MAKDFKPKKTVTIQLSLEMYEQMQRLLVMLNLTKTKLLEKLITGAYHDLFSEQCVR